MTHTHNADVRALEALVVDNPELERLEALLDQFNIFEALGVTRQELRHSDFLAYLLNPRQPHGLGDALAKAVLRRVLSANRSRRLPIGLIDLDVWDFGAMSVRREWKHIDILLLDSAHRFVVLIENKVDTGEHSNQLQRYWELVQRSYPGWRIIGLYLTPGGTQPSDERFFALGYTTICTALEDLLGRRAATIGADVQLLIGHYTQMLRRHIMGNSEIGQLCQRIYTRHRRAFDLINQHLQERLDTRRRFLENLVRQSETPRLLLDPRDGGGRYIRFVPQGWDTPVLQQGEVGWSKFRRMLLFEFDNQRDSLVLALTLGPGPAAVRAGLFDIVLANLDRFDPGVMTLSPRYHRIMQRAVLSADQIGDLSDDEVEAEIRLAWRQLLEIDLPPIDALLRAQPWIWQAATPPPARLPNDLGDEALPAP